MRGTAALNGMMRNQPRNGPQAACLVEAEPRAARPGFPPSVTEYQNAIRTTCPASMLALNRAAVQRRGRNTVGFDRNRIQRPPRRRWRGSGIHIGAPMRNKGSRQHGITASVVRRVSYCNLTCCDGECITYNAGICAQDQICCHKSHIVCGNPNGSAPCYPAGSNYLTSSNGQQGSRTVRQPAHRVSTGSAHLASGCARWFWHGANPLVSATGGMAI